MIMVPAISNVRTPRGLIDRSLARSLARSLDRSAGRLARSPEIDRALDAHVNDGGGPRFASDREGVHPRDRAHDCCERSAGVATCSAEKCDNRIGRMEARIP